MQHDQLAPSSAEHDVPAAEIPAANSPADNFEAHSGDFEAHGGNFHAHGGSGDDPSSRRAPASSTAVTSGTAPDVVQFVPAQARFAPWHDPIVDDDGHDPRSWYFERYWLSVIGPTATMVMRRLADEFDDRPDGFVLDLDHTATTMGLSFKRGHASPFGKALYRCVMFGLARQVTDGFVVRRRVPPIAKRHLARLPDDVQAEHDAWLRRGGPVDTTELAGQLRAVGFSTQVATRAADAVRLAG